MTPRLREECSIIDYIFRTLGVEYPKRYDLAHVMPEEVAVEMAEPGFRLLRPLSEQLIVLIVR